MLCPKGCASEAEGQAVAVVRLLAGGTRGHERRGYIGSKEAAASVTAYLF